MLLNCSLLQAGRQKASPQDIDVSSSILPPEEALKTDFYSHTEEVSQQKWTLELLWTLLRLTITSWAWAEDPVLVTEPGLELLFAWCMWKALAAFHSMPGSFLCHCLLDWKEMTAVNLFLEIFDSLNMLNEFQLFMGFYLVQGKTYWIVQTIPVVTFFNKRLGVTEE